MCSRPPRAVPDAQARQRKAWRGDAGVGRLGGMAAQADEPIKLPPLGVLRSGAEKPEEEELLPAEQLQALRSET